MQAKLSTISHEIIFMALIIWNLNIHTIAHTSIVSQKISNANTTKAVNQINKDFRSYAFTSICYGTPYSAHTLVYKSCDCTSQMVQMFELRPKVTDLV